MENEILLAELTRNCEGKKQKVLDLLQAYDLACLGYDMREQHEKEIINRVLQENEFYADKDFCRWDIDIKVGDRITDEEQTYLLSKEDFDRLFKLARPICVAEKLTDEDGRFLEDWATIRSNARLELVTYLVYEIIPESLRIHFDSCRWNIVQSDKLINIFKKCLLKAA